MKKVLIELEKNRTSIIESARYMKMRAHVRMSDGVNGTVVLIAFALDRDA